MLEPLNPNRLRALAEDGDDTRYILRDLAKWYF